MDNKELLETIDSTRFHVAAQLGTHSLRFKTLTRARNLIEGGTAPDLAISIAQGEFEKAHSERVKRKKVRNF